MGLVQVDILKGHVQYPDIVLSAVSAYLKQPIVIFRADHIWSTNYITDLKQVGVYIFEHAGYFYNMCHKDEVITNNNIDYTPDFEDDDPFAWQIDTTTQECKYTVIKFIW